MESWIKGDATYYFDIINNEACLYKIGFKGKKPKTVEIPDKVQYNGTVYPVTQLKGWEYVRQKEELVTDRRRKDYGTYVPVPGAYYRFKAPILEEDRYSDRTVEQVILPKTIKVVGPHSFKECKALKCIKLNNGLKEIGEYAFYDCKALKEITIPSSVKKIGTGCFNGTTVSIKIQNKPGSVEFESNAVGSDDNVTYVGKSLFSKLFG